MNAELEAAGSGLVGNDELLAAILKTSGDCIKILDLDGRLQFMSDGGKAVMEVDDFGALKGCPWPDFWTGVGNDAARHAIAEARAGRSARFTGDANTARGTPRYWDVQVVPLPGTDGKPAHILSISRDITERKDSERREKIMREELLHRIKNTFALVGVIASQTLRGEAIAGQRDAFGQRLQALSAAQDILLSGEPGAGTLAEVAEAALVPHRADAGQIVASGPDVLLSPRQAVSLSLALHELATNAAKYGALSTAGGTVRLTWATDAHDEAGQPTFKLLWRETGGPAVTAPTRVGFGSRLIQRVLAGDFGGTVSLDYHPDGLVCLLVAPVTRLGGD